MRTNSTYSRIDHVCAACGAEAVIEGGRVVVPHLRGCPVATQVERRRARVRAAASVAGQALAWGSFALVVVVCVAQLGVT